MIECYNTQDNTAMPVLAQHEQLCLSARKAVISNLLYRSLLSSCGPGELPGKARRRIAAALANAVEDELETPENATPLDAFLKSLFDRCSDIANGFMPTPGHNVKLASFIDSHRAALTELCCKECVASIGAAHICDGRDADCSNLAKGGKCFLPFSELFAIVNNACAKAYTSYAQIAMSSLPSVALSTMWVKGGGVHGLPKNELKTHAITLYNDTERGHESIIQVTLAAVAFAQDDFASLYYLFFHEMICHAYQGLGGMPREATDDECPYSEGWMDYVAFLLCEDGIRGAGTEWRGTFFENPPRWLELLAETANIYHKSLHIGRSSQYGKLAAQRLYNAYEEHCGSREKAKEALLKFSICYNALNVPADVRVELPELVLDLCGNWEPNRRSECLEAIRIFLDERDYVQLHRSLDSLRNSLAAT